MADPNYEVPSYLIPKREDPATWVIPAMKMGLDAQQHRDKMVLETKHLELESQKLQLERQMNEARMEGQRLKNQELSKEINDFALAAPTFGQWAKGNFDAELDPGITSGAVLQHADTVFDNALTKTVEGQARKAQGQRYLHTIYKIPEAASYLSQFKPYSPQWTETLTKIGIAADNIQKAEELKEYTDKEEVKNKGQLEIQDKIGERDMNRQASLDARNRASLEASAAKAEAERNAREDARTKVLAAKEEENRKRLTQESFNQEMTTIRNDTMLVGQGAKQKAIMAKKREPRYQELFPEENKPAAFLSDMHKMTQEMADLSKQMSEAASKVSKANYGGGKNVKAVKELQQKFDAKAKEFDDFKSQYHDRLDGDSTFGPPPPPRVMNWDPATGTFN